MRRLHWFVLLGGLLLSACASPTGSGRADESNSLTESLSILCVEGCLDPDPDPEAVGYFLPGTENQWAACADWSIDLDQDGLDDNCEYKLAHKFRPLMSFAVGDDVSREARWAVEWFDGDNATKTVRIAYMPGYWMDYGDGGTSETLCEIAGVVPIFWPFVTLETCGGHTGDSEFIRLDVKYDSNTQHWYLVDALYSAHTWHVNFVLQSTDSALYVSPSSDGGGPYSGNYLEYPEKIGGYPVAYVADRKHANYPTRSYCNGPGGLGGADQCDLPRTTTRIEVSQAGNIGSRFSPIIDCVASQSTSHPAVGSGRQECYWTIRDFRGWFPTAAGGGSASSYSQILADHFWF